MALKNGKTELTLEKEEICLGVEFKIEDCVPELDGLLSPRNKENGF